MIKCKTCERLMDDNYFYKDANGDRNTICKDCVDRTINFKNTKGLMHCLTKYGFKYNPYLAALCEAYRISTPERLARYRFLDLYMYAAKHSLSFGEFDDLSFKDIVEIFSGYDPNNEKEPSMEEGIKVLRKEEKYDSVDKPKHYNREGAMQCFDEFELIHGITAAKWACLFNIHKYRYRAADKNGIEDLKKSDWYMQKYKELCEKEKTTQKKTYWGTD